MFQIECHPYLNQSKMIAFCKERGIVVTAYAPLGRPGGTVNYMRHDVPPLLQDAKLQQIATKHGKTVAQIILRYLVRNSNKSLSGIYGGQNNTGTSFLNALTYLFLSILHSQPDVLLLIREVLGSNLGPETG
jgi:hypothetical protein